MKGIYSTRAVAVSVAQRQANMTGDAWAVSRCDGLGVVRWEVFPAYKVREGEQAEIRQPTRGNEP